MSGFALRKMGTSRLTALFAPVRQGWQALVRWVGRLSQPQKLAGLTVAMVAVLGVSLTVYLRLIFGEARAAGQNTLSQAMLDTITLQMLLVTLFTIVVILGVGFWFVFPAYNRRLQRRNRELEMLNAIVQAVNAPLNLDETLKKALDQVLAVADSDVGWICFLEADGSCKAFVGRQGLCWPTEAGGVSQCLRDCVCHRLQQTGEIVVINTLREGCPLRQVKTETGRPVLGHVSIPLKTKTRIVGQLNIAFSNEASIRQLDLELLQAVGPQLGVAIENARLWEEVQQKEALRAGLLKKVVLAQEEERRRIARELHDEWGQALTSLLIGLKVTEGAATSPRVQTVHGEMKATVARMFDSVHSLALELRPSLLDDLGLVPALANYVRNWPARFGVQIDFAAPGMTGLRLPREIEITLYRVVQEALTNVARHAQAQRASVLLERRGNSVVAIVEDNGRGFNVAEFMSEQAARQHLGLYGLQERASLIGGQFTVESTLGRGTTVYVEVPLSREGEA
jgi:signal transduction histidine kinase